MHREILMIKSGPRISQKANNNQNPASTAAVMLGVITEERPAAAPVNAAGNELVVLAIAALVITPQVAEEVVHGVSAVVAAVAVTNTLFVHGTSVVKVRVKVARLDWWQVQVSL